MTTTTLRPDSTLFAADSRTGAASDHAALSDDSDASYVSSTSTTSGVGLGTFTLPADAIVTTVALRARTKNALGRVTLKQNADGSGASYIFLSCPASGSFANSASAPLVLALNQAAINALSLTYNRSAASGQTDFAEMYVDVQYVVKPVTTVAAVTPDPLTATNVASVSWANTLDADGGAQTRYRLKVFTAAQYGAGGFDPETSTAFYDSGDTVSGAVTANTAPLDTATTYRAYVKVAQTVNGAAHWSDWAFDQFAVDVETADIDTITAAGSNPDASITVTVERDTSSEAWTFIEVQRSIDNGATWSPVRGATYVDATGDADTFSVIDYEVGNDVAALYRARATRIVSTLPITGAWLQTSASASWSSRRLWVKSPTDPTLNASFTLQSTISPNYRIRRGVFDVIGSATPVVVSDVRSSANGTLALLVTTDDDSPLDLLSEPVVLLHAPQDWGIEPMYVSLGNVTQGRGRKVFGRYIIWVADFVEVDTPGDPAASAP